MDWLEFISNIVSSLAWPATLVLIILILRKPIIDLLPNVHRFKYKEFEVEFKNRLKEVKALDIELQKNPIKGLPKGSREMEPQSPETDRSQLMRLAEISPRVAVIEAWRMIENALSDLVIRAGENPTSSIFFTRMIPLLTKKEIIETNFAKALNDLRSLRNEAVHAPEFALGEKSAIDYISVAIIVVNQIKKIEIKK